MKVDFKYERALDCGAGIGRVSKTFLLKKFKTVDLVEQNPTYLKVAEDALKGTNDDGRYYHKGL